MITPEQLWKLEELLRELALKKAATNAMNSQPKEPGPFIDKRVRITVKEIE